MGRRTPSTAWAFLTKYNGRDLGHRSLVEVRQTLVLGHAEWAGATGHVAVGHVDGNA